LDFNLILQNQCTKQECDQLLLLPVLVLVVASYLATKVMKLHGVAVFTHAGGLSSCSPRWSAMITYVWCRPSHATWCYYSSPT